MLVVPLTIIVFILSSMLLLLFFFLLAFSIFPQLLLGRVCLLPFQAVSATWQHVRVFSKDGSASGVGAADNGLRDHAFLLVTCFLLVPVLPQ
jgi:hypothetical protein